MVPSFHHRPHLRPSRILSLFAATLLTCMVLGAGLSEAGSPDVRTAQVAGSRVAYRILGEGETVIVLISGLGDGMASFDAVAAQLARDATVIVYDRAGYGRSEARTGPRDAAAIEHELSGLLAAIGVRGPVFIAGHSIGGLFAEYFAAHHPDQVIGLILEESRPADFTPRCLTAGIEMCTPPSLLVRFMPRGARAEFAALEQTAAQAGPAQPVDLPVLVLSRPVARNASTFDALWAQAQADLAHRYDASHAHAPAGGHYIHQDQPEWFISQVQRFVASGQAVDGSASD